MNWTHLSVPLLQSHLMPPDVRNETTCVVTTCRKYGNSAGCSSSVARVKALGALPSPKRAPAREPPTVLPCPFPQPGWPLCAEASGPPDGTVALALLEERLLGRSGTWQRGPYSFFVLPGSLPLPFFFSFLVSNHSASFAPDFPVFMALSHMFFCLGSFLLFYLGSTSSFKHY